MEALRDRGSTPRASTAKQATKGNLGGFFLELAVICWVYGNMAIPFSQIRYNIKLQDNLIMHKHV